MYNTSIYYGYTENIAEDGISRTYHWEQVWSFDSSVPKLLIIPQPGITTMSECETKNK